MTEDEKIREAIVNEYRKQVVGRYDSLRLDEGSIMFPTKDQLDDKYVTMIRQIIDDLAVAKADLWISKNK